MKLELTNPGSKKLNEVFGLTDQRYKELMLKCVDCVLQNSTVSQAIRQVAELCHTQEEMACMIFQTGYVYNDVAMGQALANAIEGLGEMEKLTDQAKDILRMHKPGKN